MLLFHCLQHLRCQWCPGHRKNRWTEHRGATAAWSSRKIFASGRGNYLDQRTNKVCKRDLNARFTRTAPEKNKLIVVVPLVLNLDLKLNKQVGFDSVQMISPGRVWCPADQRVPRFPIHKTQPSYGGKISWSSENLWMWNYLNPATQSWSNACSRSVCLRKNLEGATSH